MLHIVVPEVEFFDERTSTFTTLKEQRLAMEHSLVSISKWEAMYNKPFLTKDKKTGKEMLDYIKCMTITQNVDERIFQVLTKENLIDVSEYIAAPMTATTFGSSGSSGTPQRQIVTSELIYYWMVSYNIPFECQKWHVNRLLTLIEILNIKNTPPKKRSKSEIMSNQKRLNAQRRRSLKTKG